MRNLFLILFFCFFASSCEDKKYGDLHPDLMKPNWKGIKTEKLNLKIGDVVSIYPGKYCYIGVVMDFDQDEGGVWYGISLSKYRWIDPYQKKISDLDFFGKRIPSGFTGDFIDCYDLLYINENIANKQIIVIKNINIDVNKISIGSIRPITNLRQIETEHARQIKERSNPNKSVERYFKIGCVLSK